MHYNINRDYNPVTGRYIQPDPIGFDGGVNGFGYAKGNPIISIDSLGLYTFDEFEAQVQVPGLCDTDEEVLAKWLEMEKII